MRKWWRWWIRASTVSSISQLELDDRRRLLIGYIFASLRLKNLPFKASFDILSACSAHLNVTMTHLMTNVPIFSAIPSAMRSFVVAPCTQWYNLCFTARVFHYSRIVHVHCSANAGEQQAASYPLYRGAETSAWYQTQPLYEFEDPSPWEVTVSGCADTVATILLHMPCEALLRMQHAHVLDACNGSSSSNTSPQVGKQWIENAWYRSESLSPVEQDLVGDVLEKLAREYKRAESRVVERWGPLSAATRRACQLASVILRTILIA